MSRISSRDSIGRAGVGRQLVQGEAAEPVDLLLGQEGRVGHPVGLERCWRPRPGTAGPAR
ncbi:MAG: hypothetical protein MZV64_49330 [Ignavibacteriales bacterium]|nr:hypothetical protein [Ignavibacteriales bacterium]